MTLLFGGYGGEYCVGSINQVELSNIKELLKRFDSSIFIGNYETNFDTTDYRDNYYDFDDIEHVSSAAIDSTIWIDDTGGIKIKEDYFSSDDCNVDITDIPTLKDGYYICSTSYEKGVFFSVDLDINPNDFDKSKLVLECKDMDGIGFSELVITGIKYDNVDIEMNFDALSTAGKGYEQTLVYAKNGNLFEGIEKIIDDFDDNDFFEVLDQINGMEEYEAVQNYLLFIEAWKNGYLLKTDDIIVFASPFLYKHFDKEDVDTLWMTEKNIKFALENDYKDQIPKDIWERVISRFPEWLI